ncbi:unnamed protein product [Rhizophagus irregularis]|nr:unnamed protein product [Rhizophagus irregularis]
MNMKKGQRVIIFSITIICLIGLLYTFKSFRFSTSQETSKLTGFPIWYEIEKSEASIAWFGYLIIIIFCSTLASLIFTHNKSIPKVYISYFIFPDHPDDNHSSTLSTKLFNKILAYFSLFTFISDLALQILYPGKLWSSFDSFHSLLELIIILYLTFGQFKFFIFFICMKYIILVNLLTITLKWPLDAIWFKMQDLMLDFALVIIFLRIYIRTYLYIKNQDSSQFPEGNDPQEEFNSNTKFSKFTNQIILLPIAAFVHMFGTIATLFVHPTGDMIFMLSHAVSFLMYTFYIYLDTHYTTNISNFKNIVLPYTPTWKLLFIFLWSIILSIFILRITALFLLISV